MTSLATMLNLESAALDTLKDPDVLEMARGIVQTIDPSLENIELARMLYNYSALIAASVMASAVIILVPESELKSLVEEWASFDHIG